MGPFMLIWLSYGPISIVLSVIVFCILVFNPKFKSLFYRLVQLDILMVSRMLVNRILSDNASEYDVFLELCHF